LQKELKLKISSIKNVSVENIFVGNGSDEAIDLLIRAFCNPAADNIVVCPPTYGMFEVCAGINDVAVKKVLLKSNFQLNKEAIKDELDKNTRVIFTCSPNNPTGNLMDTSDIEFLLQQFTGIVVVDEAYIDFAETETWLNKIHKYPNLVVLQTLSKAWGLAALRVGLAFASQDIIHVLNKIKPPYNISGITQRLALDALYKEEQKQEKVNIIREEKDKLQQLFSELSFIENVNPSDANFILVKTNDALKLYRYLVAQNIIVRNRSNQPLCENCLRITVGTAQENEMLSEALKNYSS